MTILATLRFPGAAGAGVPWPREPAMADVRLPPPAGWTNSTICNYSLPYAPELSRETDRLAIVLLLRDLVYRRCPMLETPGWITTQHWLDFNARYADCIVNQSHGHQCQGRGYLFLMACKAFGIPGRYIGMWGEISGLTETSLTHAAIEVFINGQWIGIDPHFNRSLRNAATGERIGYRQAQTIIATGGSVMLDYDGFAPIPGVTFEDYIPSLTDLLQYIMVGIHAGSSVAVPYAMTGSWDGVLDYAASGPFDAKTMAQGPVYQALVL